MSQAAFPHIDTDEHGRIYTYQTGMTLRDYFAAKAMQSFLTHPLNHQLDTEGIWLDCALDSYRMADAMLKARDE